MHALRATIWYPAAADAREQPQWIGPRIVPFVSTGSAAPDAAPAAGLRPLIVLSHGFGGSAANLAWLGAGLAAHGFIAVAVNHPGNNGSERTTVDGYALMWLRAVDLSALIDAMRADSTFGDRIDPGADRRRRPFVWRLHSYRHRRRHHRSGTDSGILPLACRRRALHGTTCRHRAAPEDLVAPERRSRIPAAL